VKCYSIKRTLTLSYSLNCIYLLCLDQIVVKVTGNCGRETINIKSNIIKSPNYPRDYGNKLDCFWFLFSTTGKRITLNPIEIVLEKCSEECTCDYLEILEEESWSKDNSFSKKLCDKRNLTNIESSGNFLHLHFHTDGRESRKGFKFIYDVKKN